MEGMSLKTMIDPESSGDQCNPLGLMADPDLEVRGVARIVPGCS